MLRMAKKCKTPQELRGLGSLASLTAHTNDA
jgi:hypothetical protein